MPTKEHDTPRPKKKVGIWIRVSTEDQVKGESPEHHEYRANTYAEMKGWEVAEIYRLDAISGKSVKDRPETKQMLEDIRMGRISGLIFSKLARLARNTRELLEFADIFREYDADLISLQEAIDTSSPAGRLFYTMLAAMAQWEREEIASRVAASVPVRATLGKPLGGVAQFGYKWVDGKLEIEPDEAPVRKKLYELFLEHKRIHIVKNKINEAGHRTRKGNKFSRRTVERLLEDPITKGKCRRNYTKRSSDDMSWDVKDEDDWIWIDVEPLVEDSVWEQVNHIIAEQRAKRKPRGKKPVQLFGGLVYCHCGDKMYKPSNTPKYVCHECRNKIPVEDLERAFHAQLKHFMNTPVDFNEILRQADDSIREKEELLSVLEKEKESVQAEMDKTYRLYIDDKISPDGFGKIYGPLEERLKQLEREIPSLQGEIDFRKIQHHSSDEILSAGKSIAEGWERFTFEEKFRIVESVVDRIEIGEGEVLIDLAFDPTSEKNPFFSEQMAKSARRGRDSNPRYACTYAGFQDQCFQPLSHPSRMSHESWDMSHECACTRD